MSSVTGIVLAGTHPWPSSSFDRLVPRALLPIANRPLVAYALAWLQRGGIQSVVVGANRQTRWLHGRIASHAPTGMALSYLEDPMPRGAAGSIRDAAATSEAQTFVVTDATSIPTVDLEAVLTTHRSSNAALTVIVHGEAHAQGDGIQAPAGIYVFDRRVIEHVPPSGFCDIKETLIPRIYRAGERVIAYSAQTTSPRVLSASTYLAVNQWAVERLVAENEPPAGYIRSDESLVHRDATIAASALLVGPVLVGPSVRVMPGAVIVGPASIGREVVIQQGALVSRSAAWRRSVISEGSVTDQCIVADDAVIAPHAQVLRTVVSADRLSTRLRQLDDQSAPARDTFGAELCRRMARSFIALNWSRSPAAQ